MGYKLNVRGASDWGNILKDLYIELDNTNWDATTLSGFLDEVQTALDGKKSRNVVKTLLSLTASAFDVILVDTTAAVTVTLPSTPVQGDEVYIVDTLGNASSQEITVAGNGSKINGVTEDLVMDVNFSSAKLIFDNATNGWHIDAGGSFLGVDNSEVNDPYITLNADFTSGTPTENGGLIMSRGGSNSAMIQWNETTDKWELTTDGTTFNEILTAGDITSIDHGDLTGLGDDDHTQYMHNTVDRTVTATHTFNPDTVGAPFVVGTNALKQLVPGLNAEYANGILFSTITHDDPTAMTAGDVWFEEFSLSSCTIPFYDTTLLAADNYDGSYNPNGPPETLNETSDGSCWYGVQIDDTSSYRATTTIADNTNGNAFDYEVFYDNGGTMTTTGLSGTNVTSASIPLAANQGLTNPSDIFIAVRMNDSADTLNLTFGTGGGG